MQGGAVLGDDNECKALAIALNRTGELATWNEETLAKTVAELSAGSFDAIKALGFNAKALDDLVAIFNGEAIKAGDVDPYSEWQGMPDYEHADKSGRIVHVHFHTAEDVAAFAAATGLAITDATRGIWYPPGSEPNESTQDTRVVGES